MYNYSLNTGHKDLKDLRCVKSLNMSEPTTLAIQQQWLEGKQAESL
jgi:hypothetical protein